MDEERHEDYEVYVAAFGEQWRVLIYDALRFLDEREPGWHLPEPIDRRHYLEELISQAQRTP
jgi:hypothetical protein